MGGLLSKKSGDTIEVLERLTKEIEKIEAAQRKHARLERQIQSAFLFYGAILFMISLVFGIAFFYAEPTLFRGALAAFFVSFAPVLVYLLYRCVRAVRASRFERRTCRARELLEQKQEILDEVADKETYKKAKEIMERFGRPRVADRLLEAPTAQIFNALARSTPAASSANVAHAVRSSVQARAVTPRSLSAVRSDAASHLARVERASESLRRRTIAKPEPEASSVPRRSSTSQSSVGEAHEPAMRNAFSAARSIFIDARSTIRPLFSSDRSVVERLTDLLLGDGPDARYALVCRHCFAHNGMALPDEYSHITFRCAYCARLNPAKTLAASDQQTSVHTTAQVQEPDTTIAQTNTVSADDTQAAQTVAADDTAKNTGERNEDEANAS